MRVRLNFMRRLKAFGRFGPLVCLALCFAAMGQVTAPNSEADVMHHLNQVLRWSARWTSADFYLAVPGDKLYVESDRTIAQQIVKLEFQSALAQAALMNGSSSTPPAASTDTTNGVNTQNIVRLQQSIGQQIQTLQSQLDELNKKIPTARANQRSAMSMRRDTIQGQLQLAQALQDNLRQLVGYVNSAENAGTASTELTRRILALQKTVPGAAIATESAGAKTASAPAITPPAPSVPLAGNSRNEGLVGQLGQLIHLIGSMRTLRQLKDETTRLRTGTQELRASLLTALRATLQQGQIQLANIGQQNGVAPGNSASPSGPSETPAGAAAEPKTPQQEQRQMKELVQHYKQLSDATLPLSRQLILLDQSQANLKQLQLSLQREYMVILRSLLLHVAMLLIALGLIWLFSELWRRASFRYIRDTRRRRQFLILRRVITGFCMVVVILLGFISDFSSLATYAGLITAGIAVALQAVILSIAAYFFLVGRYGVRVGDRVTVVYNGPNSVTGDVVDIGLVRFYLMELAGNDIEMKPTGRIVVFPNSVLFQTNPLFKQLPGTEYIWREIGLPLDRESDFQLAEKELLAIANEVYTQYRPLLQTQHVNIEETIGLALETPKPYTRIRFIASGLEVVVCYPVPLRQASASDDRMVMEVMEVLSKNPSLHLADGAAPDMRSRLTR